VKCVSLHSVRTSSQHSAGKVAIEDDQVLANSLVLSLWALIWYGPACSGCRHKDVKAGQLLMTFALPSSCLCHALTPRPCFGNKPRRVVLHSVFSFFVATYYASRISVKIRANSAVWPDLDFQIMRIGILCCWPFMPGFRQRCCRLAVVRLRSPITLAILESGTARRDTFSCGSLCTFSGELSETVFWLRIRLPRSVPRSNANVSDRA